MAEMGPEDRERFARRDEGPLSSTSVRREPDRERSMKVLAGGSITEALCGAATVVLAIIGLAGTSVPPGDVASVAAIVFGVALMAQGAAVASRFNQLLRETAPHDWDARSELGSGVGAELVGGAAGIVLGILGLIGLGQPVLIPIAVIVFGGALLLGSGAAAELSSLRVPSAHEHFANVARQASSAASGTQVLVGLGAIVLGILALLGVSPVMTTMVALLVLGASVVLTGGAISSRMVALLRH
jgi:uncharacterized membrane protein HdeD (DUF308 family)